MCDKEQLHVPPISIEPRKVSRWTQNMICTLKRVSNALKRKGVSAGIS